MAVGPLYLCFNLPHQQAQINFLVQQYPYCAYTMQYDFLIIKMNKKSIVMQSN